MKREDYAKLILKALKSKNRPMMIWEVAKYIWTNHLEKTHIDERVKYTYQYDMRWGAQKLRDEGLIESVDGTWRLLK